MCKSRSSAFQLQYNLSLDMLVSGACRHTFGEEGAAILSHANLAKNSGGRLPISVSDFADVIILCSRPSSLWQKCQLLHAYNLLGYA